MYVSSRFTNDDPDTDGDRCTREPSTPSAHRLATVAHPPPTKHNTVTTAIEALPDFPHSIFSHIYMQLTARPKASHSPSTAPEYMRPKWRAKGRIQGRRRVVCATYSVRAAQISMDAICDMLPSYMRRDVGPGNKACSGHRMQIGAHFGTDEQRPRTPCTGRVTDLPVLPETLLRKTHRSNRKLRAGQHATPRSTQRWRSNHKRTATSRALNPHVRIHNYTQANPEGTVGNMNPLEAALFVQIATAAERGRAFAKMTASRFPQPSRRTPPAADRL